MAAIPFDTPAQFFAAEKAGQIVRYGAILKDAGTGQIVGHLQETGVASKLLGLGAKGAVGAVQSGLNPISAAASILGAVDSGLQMRQMNEKLTAMQSMLGGVQTMGMASLVLQGIGIGVTVASTAIILSRLKGISEGLHDLGRRIDAIAQDIQQDRLFELLDDTRTSLERFEELGTRKDRSAGLLGLEESLQRTHDKLAGVAERIAQREKINEELLGVLIKGMLVSSGASLKALMAADEVDTALLRSESHAKRFRGIVWALPDDRLKGQDAKQVGLPVFLREGMAQQSSHPSLFKALLDKGYKGSDYLISTSEQTEEPVVILPQNSALS